MPDYAPKLPTTAPGGRNRHWRHPRMADATQKDRRYFKRRRARITAAQTVIGALVDFFINTIQPLRRKVRWPWFESQQD